MKTFTFFFFLIFLAPATHAQNYMITFAGTGAATTVDSVHVQNLTQCTDTSLAGNAVLNLSATAGINTFADDGIISLNIFPNPSEGRCTASLEAPANGNTTIEVLDAIGKRIAQTQQFLSKGQHTFNIQGIGNGVYLLKIQSEKYSATAKLLSNNTTVENLSITETSAFDFPKNEKTKGTKNTISMLFHSGDTLFFKGYSGIYKTVMVLMPTQDQTVTFNFIPCTDADGNNYAVVQIGTQVWMEENLKTTKYSNGDAIAHISNLSQWQNLTTGAYCYYNNDPHLESIYGCFYNWYAASDARNICPTGWHLPSSNEWEILIFYLGDTLVAGGKLKDKCSNLWYYPNIGATNESGFSARPGGGCDSFNGFYNLSLVSSWWSFTVDPDDNNYIICYKIQEYETNTYTTYGYRTEGTYLRCIKN